MAYDFNGTSDYIEATSAVLTGVPLTMACWFNSDSATLTQTLFSISDEDADQHFSLRAAGAVTDDPVQCFTNASNARAPASGTAGYQANTWHHAAGVFAAVNSRRAFFDGVGGTTTTGSSTPTGLDRTGIGFRYITSVRSQRTDGRIAECGIWNVALDDAEIAALAKGYRCSLIRPQNLVFYVPHVREAIDHARGLSLTTSGAVVAIHPRRVA